MSNHTLIFRFLKLICPAHLYEEIEGDLIQKYARDTMKFGVRRANRRLMWNSARFLRPGIIFRNRISTNLIQYFMIRIYMTMAWRYLRKDRTFSSISIFGLSVSIAVSIIIFQYADFEFSYERFNESSDKIYRVTKQTYDKGQLTYETALTASRLAPVLNEKLPAVEDAVRLISTRSWFECALSYTNNGNTTIFNEHKLYYADPSVLSVFSCSLIEGNAVTALKKPFSAVLSEAAARRYFGNERAVGKILHLKGSSEEGDYTVTGVMNNTPYNSHIDADIFLSIFSLEKNQYFGNFDAYTYVRAASNGDVKILEQNLNDLIAADFPNAAGVTSKNILLLQPIGDIHLRSSVQDEIKPGNSIQSVYFLILVAFAILIIAWINYINLATSRSLMRAKEVGIRKVAGANRFQLTGQFLSEAIIINGISFAAGTVLAYCLASYFYSATGLFVPNDQFFDFAFNRTGLVVMAIFLAGIFISGIYPAHMISSHNPALVLKGKIFGKKEGFTLRKALVTFQFTCAIALTIAVLTFNRQLGFMQAKELGIDIHKTIVARAPVVADSSYVIRMSAFKSKLASSGIISSVATSTAIPGEEIGWTGVIRKRNDDTDPGFNFVINVVDTDFISNYKLRLLAGRNFEVADYPHGKFGSKTESVIVNNTGLKQLGFESADEAIHATIYWGVNKCEVVGVVDDFHQQSLKYNVQPVLLTANNGPQLSMKLGADVNDSNISGSLATIQSTWKAFFPDNQFDYFFLDNFYERQYTGDKQIMNLFQLFSFIAIMISSLGLFGLASFTARQRTREMSIRKILGASTVQLVSILGKEFLILVAIASLLAIPVSYFGAEKWLERFAAHIDLNVLLFAVPILGVLIVAAFTIALQIIRTALSNPVETLKYE